MESMSSQAKNIICSSVPPHHADAALPPPVLAGCSSLYCVCNTNNCRGEGTHALIKGRAPNEPPGRDCGMYCPTINSLRCAVLCPWGGRSVAFSVIGSCWVDFRARCEVGVGGVKMSYYHQHTITTTIPSRQKPLLRVRSLRVLKPTLCSKIVAASLRITFDEAAVRSTPSCCLCRKAGIVLAVTLHRARVNREYIDYTR